MFAWLLERVVTCFSQKPSKNWMKPGFEPATSPTDREANEMTIGNGKCTVQRQSSKCRWDRFQVGVKVGDTRVVRKARNSISAERDESDAMQPIAVEANNSKQRWVKFGCFRKTSKNLLKPLSTKITEQQLGMNQKRCNRSWWNPRTDETRSKDKSDNPKN